MPYFAEGIPKNKLIVLFFLHALGVELTKEQLTTVIAEKELIPFFELHSAAYEMEEEGFLAMVPRAYGQVYAVTPKGAEILQLFEEQLPLSLREDLLDYADHCREKLRRETQFSACYDKDPNGGYTAELRILEHNDALLKLSVRLPDTETVREVCRSWPDRAENVYRLLIEKLTEQ